MAPLRNHLPPAAGVLATAAVILALLAPGPALAPTSGSVDCSGNFCAIGVEAPGSAKPPPKAKVKPVVRQPGRPAAPPVDLKPFQLGAQGAAGALAPGNPLLLLPTGPPAPNAPAPARRPAPVAPLAPSAIAQRVTAELRLAPPAVRMAPPPGSLGATVGAPVWMWVRPGPQSTGPITRTVALPGTSVTATARLSRVEWSMGDGGGVTCTGPGTPWTASQAGQASPDCGYVYGRTSPAASVTATAVWAVTWTGAAQGGTDLRVDSIVTLPVREIRTLNTGS